MGLIRAAVGAAGGLLADQWKEFFYCDALDKNTLMVKGQKRTTSRSTNTKGNDNIISNGSGIAVADGQCMLIVEQGRVVEVCAEPGEFTWNNSTEPSIFAGSLGESLKNSFKTLGRRFTYGGDTGKDQRVYYINTKEILDNKFGTPTPIMFRVVDSRYRRVRQMQRRLFLQDRGSHRVLHQHLRERRGFLQERGTGFPAEDRIRGRAFSRFRLAGRAGAASLHDPLSHQRAA